LSPKDSREIEFRIPANSLEPANYLIVSTVNEVDLLQVASFEVFAKPKLVAKLGQTCGGYQNISCARGLYCDLDGKEGLQYGICKLSYIDTRFLEANTIRPNLEGGRTSSRIDRVNNEQIGVQKVEFDILSNQLSPSRNTNTNSEAFFVPNLQNGLDSKYFVSRSEFYSALHFLNPNIVLSSSSNKFISRQEAIYLFIKTQYSHGIPRQLDGFHFVDTIFSPYQKSIDFAYENNLLVKNSRYFRPKDFLSWDEFDFWRASL